MLISALLIDLRVRTFCGSRSDFHLLVEDRYLWSFSLTTANVVAEASWSAHASFHEMRAGRCPTGSSRSRARRAEASATSVSEAGTPTNSLAGQLWLALFYPHPTHHMPEACADTPRATTRCWSHSLPSLCGERRSRLSVAAAWLKRRGRSRALPELANYQNFRRFCTTFCQVV